MYAVDKGTHVYYILNLRHTILLLNYPNYQQTITVMRLTFTLFSTKNEHNSYRFSIFFPLLAHALGAPQSLVILLRGLFLVWRMFESHIFISLLWWARKNPKDLVGRQVRTWLKVVLLLVRREISSTFGLKTASWALPPGSERRGSQGERWVWLKMNDSFVENARAKVNFASEHGLNTGFVSHASA